MTEYETGSLTEKRNGIGNVNKRSMYIRRTQLHVNQIISYIFRVLAKQTSGPVLE